MEKIKIAFFCEKPSDFLVRSMTAGLERAGYEIRMLTPSADLFTLQDKGFSIFMVYIEGYKNEYGVLLSGLQMFLVHPGIKLFLIGTENDIRLAYSYVQPKFISHAFKRPVNIEDIIKKINSDVSGYVYKNDLRIPDEGSIDRSRKSILIVDDDPTYVRTLESWMQKEFNIYTANSAMNAISFLKGFPVDLLLLDYEMPVISGLDLFHLLKSDPATANLPVIFLTAKDDKDTVMEVIAARPWNYLLKSTSPLLLLEEVRSFFNSRAAETEDAGE